MANRALLRDPAGNVVLPGSINKVLTEDFLFTTALPSWLSASAGTPTFTSAASSRGELTMTTSGTASSTATLQTAQAIDLSKVEAVMWTVEGFFVDSNAGINMFFGIGTSGNGAYCSATPDPVLKYASADPGVAVSDYWLSSNEWQRRKSRTFLVNCQTKHAYVLEHGQVIADVDLSATMVLGPVNPGITVVQATGTVARNLKIGRVSLTVSTY